MSLEGLQLGRYRLIRCIGRGGMGEVYLAEDSNINRQVALKVVCTDEAHNTSISGAQEAYKHFLREAQTIAKLDHPHILPLFDYGEQTVDGSILTYLVMPFRQEGTLGEWLKHLASPEPLPPEDIAALLAQAASALQYAHDHQVVHQDVKPSNFLIRGNPNEQSRPDILLADFGIARLTDATVHTTQNPRGTPKYMAPEQWEGHPVPATDQYALAVMTYELLTGTFPFQGNIGQLMYAHMQTPPPPPSTHNSHLSQAIDDVILRALAKKPEDRFPSVMAFYQAVRQALNESAQKTVHASMLSTRREDHAATTVVDASPQTSHWEEKHDQRGYDTPSLPDKRAREAQTQRSVHRRRMIVLVAILTLLLITVGVIGMVLTQGNSSPILDTRATAQARLALTQQAQAVATKNAQATATAAAGSPYPPNGGTLVLDDSLSSASSTSGWAEENKLLVGACEFTDQKYHVSKEFSGTEVCLAHNTNFQDFAYQVQMTIIDGDTGGIVVRGDANNAKNFYYCFVKTDGTYGIALYAEGSSPTTLTSGSNAAINTGQDQENLLAVVAHGGDLEFYVNHQHIASTHDTTYASGSIGVAAHSTLGNVEATFRNAKVWKY